MILRNAMWSLVGISLFFFASTIVVAGDEQLYGTWRLVSFKTTVVATGETMEPLGKSPRGFINYGQDRFFAMIVGDKRPKPPDMVKITDQEAVELMRTMVAYGGTYTYDGKTVTAHVDICWIEAWTGTDQVRQVTFDGNKLILTTLPQPGPPDGRLVTGVVTWERVQ